MKTTICEHWCTTFFLFLS